MRAGCGKQRWGGYPDSGLAWPTVESRPHRSCSPAVTAQKNSSEEHHPANTSRRRRSPSADSAAERSKMKLAVIPGDGIGPEVVAEGLKVLRGVVPGVQTTEYDVTS